MSITEDYQNHEKSIQKVKSHIIDDLSKRDFIVFAGAGLSERTGIPLWCDLLKKLNEKHSLNGVIIDDVKEYQYPNIAQMLYDEFEQNENIKAYMETIQSVTQASKIPYTPTQEEITLACEGKIVTTNFDETFESVFKKLQRRGNIDSELTLQTLPNFEIRNIIKKYNIVYLHGKPSEGEIIFKTSDYKKYYPSLEDGEESSLENLLKFLYVESNMTVVFIGFSFEDSYIRKTIERIYKEKCPEIGDIVKHYVFLENKVGENPDFSKTIIKKLFNDMKIKQEQLESINVNTFWYKQDYPTEIYNIFVQINELRKNKKALASPEDQLSF